MTDPFNVIVAVLGGAVLLLGLPSAWLSRSPFPPTLLALVLGIAIGPAGLDILDPTRLGEAPVIREKLARLVLAIGLMGVALRIPRLFPRRHPRDLLALLGLGMPLMWAASTALAYGLLDLPFWTAALVGAIVTPNDPVAATPIVTGSLAERNIPARLRHAISFESGANDGIAYLLVLLPILVLTPPEGGTLRHWLLQTLGWDVLGATAIGIALGWAAAALLRTAARRRAIQGEWRLVYTVALALLAAGLGRIVGSDEVLVVFAAGVAFAQKVDAPEREEEDKGQEAVNRFFAFPFFVLVGTALPWGAWLELGWSGLLFALLLLLLRRPPVLLLLRPLLPGVRGARDALFVGWFGPVAVSAVYYASLAEHRLSDPLAWHVVSLVVAVSTLLHGLTGAPLTRLYARSGRPGGSEAEAEEEASPGEADPG